MNYTGVSCGNWETWRLSWDSHGETTTAKVKEAALGIWQVPDKRPGFQRFDAHGLVVVSESKSCHFHELLIPVHLPYFPEYS